MTRDEFVLVYTRFHFDIYKDDDWNKLKDASQWIKEAQELTSFRANEFYNYLVSKGELKGELKDDDKSCDTCKTRNVCTFKYVSINGNKREFCSVYERGQT